MSTSTSSTQSKSRYEIYRLKAASLEARRQPEQPAASRQASSDLAAPLDSQLAASAAPAQGPGFQDGPSHHAPPWLRDRHASADPLPLRAPTSPASSFHRLER